MLKRHSHDSNFQEASMDMLLQMDALRQAIKGHLHAGISVLRTNMKRRLWLLYCVLKSQITRRQWWYLIRGFAGNESGQMSFRMKFLGDEEIDLQFFSESRMSWT